MKLKVRKGVQYRMSDGGVVSFIEFGTHINMILYNQGGVQIGASQVPNFNIRNQVQAAKHIQNVSKNDLKVIKLLYTVYPSDNSRPELQFLVSDNGSNGVLINYTAYGNLHTVPSRRPFSSHSAIEEDCKKIYSSIFEG